MKTLFSGRMGKIATVAAVCALSLTLAGSAFAKGKQDFTLHNETKLEIVEVYVSAANVDNWEEDVLGDDTLSPGEEVDISFNSKEKADKWDLKVVDDNGKSWVWKSLNLSMITDVSI